MFPLARTPRRSPAARPSSPPSDRQRTAAISPQSPSPEDENLDEFFDRLPPLLEWKWSPIPTQAKPIPATPKITILPSTPSAEKDEEDSKLLPVFAPKRRPRSTSCRKTPTSNPWLEMVIPASAAAATEWSDFSETMSDPLRSSGITSEALYSYGDETETESSRGEGKRQVGGASGRRLPEESVKVLQAWLEAHMADPYASREEKEQLACSSRLGYKQVSNWISNARGKLKMRRCTVKK